MRACACTSLRSDSMVFLIVMSSATSNFTGYGPSSRTLMLYGDRNSYEIWEEMFILYLRLKKLHKYVINRYDELMSGPVAVVVGATQRSFKLNNACERNSLYRIIRNNQSLIRSVATTCALLGS